jgi:hypothetical protein
MVHCLYYGNSKLLAHAPFSFLHPVKSHLSQLPHHLHQLQYQYSLPY